MVCIFRFGGLHLPLRVVCIFRFGGLHIPLGESPPPLNMPIPIPAPASDSLSVNCIVLVIEGINLSIDHLFVLLIEFGG